MRIGVLISIAAALFTAVASAQETIYLQNADSPQSMQGIRNAVLAISGASSASVDAEKKAGFWVNENSANMEDDPVLVTAYAMLSLEAALGKTSER